MVSRLEVLREALWVCLGSDKSGACAETSDAGHEGKLGTLSPGCLGLECEA